MKPLEEDRGKALWSWTGQGTFGYEIWKAQVTKAKIDKWHHIKLKTFHTTKETTEQRGNLPNGRKYSQIVLFFCCFLPFYTLHDWLVSQSAGTLPISAFSLIVCFILVILQGLIGGRNIVGMIEKGVEAENWNF
jgi:hypothetical protein